MPGQTESLPVKPLLAKQRLQPGMGVHQPGQPEPSRPSHGLVGVGRQPDGRTSRLHRAHRQPHSLQPQRRVLVRHRLAAPQLPDEAQVANEAADPLLLCQAEGGILLRAVTQTHPHDEPPAGQSVQGGQLLGDIHRVQQGQKQDPGAEAHRRPHFGRCPGQEGNRLEHLVVAQHVVLGQQDGVEPLPGAQGNLRQELARPLPRVLPRWKLQVKQQADLDAVCHASAPGRTIATHPTGSRHGRCPPPRPSPLGGRRPAPRPLLPADGV